MSDDDMISHHTTDALGNRILRGLTPSETAELERMWQNRRDSRDTDETRFLDLSRRVDEAITATRGTRA